MWASDASFLGELLSVAGIASHDGTPADLAERYLGALTFPPECEGAVRALAAAAATTATRDAATLTAAFFSMSDATLAVRTCMPPLRFLKRMLWGQLAC